jgi:hypothetical protein
MIILASEFGESAWSIKSHSCGREKKIKSREDVSLFMVIMKHLTNLYMPTNNEEHWALLLLYNKLGLSSRLAQVSLIQTLSIPLTKYQRKKNNKQNKTKLSIPKAPTNPMLLECRVPL